MSLTDRQRTRIRRLLRRGKNSEEIAKITAIDKGSVVAYSASVTKERELRKIRKQLLILECTSEAKEDRSESLLLNELIRIIGTPNQPRLVKVRGRQPFLEEMENAEEFFIHISAHGRFRKGKRVCRTRIHFPSGKSVYASDLRKLWSKRRSSKKPKLILLSACQTGRQDLAEAFYEAGCRYFIAPEEDVYWFDAAVFLTIFYNLLLSENHSPWVAYKKADYGLRQMFPNLSGNWQFFDRGVRRTYKWPTNGGYRS
jgi:CHAT domain-containing protein